MPQGGKAKGSSSKYQQLVSTTPLLKCRFIQTKHKGAVCELPVARDGGTQEIAGCVQGEVLCSSTLEKPRERPLVTGKCKVWEHSAFSSQGPPKFSPPGPREEEESWCQDESTVAACSLVDTVQDS